MSNVKKKVMYGKSGDKVKIVSDNGNVLIVEDKAGNRFPASKEAVTHTN